MSEGLKWEAWKREGLAPGFLGLVHQHIKGRKTGALNHQRSMERSENGYERCRSYEDGMPEGPCFGSGLDCWRRVLLSQWVKAVRLKRQA